MQVENYHNESVLSHGRAKFIPKKYRSPCRCVQVRGYAIRQDILMEFGLGGDMSLWAPLMLNLISSDSIYIWYDRLSKCKHRGHAHHRS